MSIDLMDERRFGWSVSFWLPGSISAEENDRFRDGERKDAGDSDD